VIDEILAELEDRLTAYQKKINGQVIEALYSDFEDIDDLIISLSEILDNDKNLTKILVWYKRQLPIMIGLSVAYFGVTAPKYTVAKLESFFDSFTKGIYNYNSRIKADALSLYIAGSEKKTIANKILTNNQLSSVAHQKMADALMMALRLTDRDIAVEENFDYALYFGTRLETSRDFCIARKGKIFSKKTIQSWNDQDWKGKIIGSDVLISLGGYNCVDSLMWVSKEVADKYGYDQLND